jgi:hypothetical protein
LQGNVKLRKLRWFPVVGDFEMGIYRQQFKASVLA